VGVIVQYGGQTPLKLALDLERAGVPIIGTSPTCIDIAEDRERFQKLLHELGLKQPPNRTARTEEKRWKKLAQEIGYPLVVRPSYVLGGRAMEIVHGDKDLERYMREAVRVSERSPVLLDRFLTTPSNVDVDCISDGEGDDRRHHGAHRASRRAQRRLGLLAAAVHAVSAKPRCRTRCAPDHGHGQGAEGGGPDERAVRHPGRRRRTCLRAGSEPARSRTVPFVSKATGSRWPRWPRAAWPASRWHRKASPKR
jgi:carbamoyl-phosphate synthase large subunit